MSPPFQSSYFYNFPGESSKPLTHECPPPEALSSKGGFRTFSCMCLYTAQWREGRWDLDTCFPVSVCLRNPQIATSFPDVSFSSAIISGSLHFLVFSSPCLVLKACVLKWLSWKEKVPAGFRRAVASSPQPHPPATAFSLWTCRLRASSST